jgi:hypothetical protein
MTDRFSYIETLQRNIVNALNDPTVNMDYIESLYKNCAYAAAELGGLAFWNTVAEGWRTVDAKIIEKFGVKELQAMKLRIWPTEEEEEEEEWNCEVDGHLFQETSRYCDVCGYKQT